jgi:shikimate kinase
MNNSKRIFVMGHMGAGKFLFAEALAKKLGWQLIDANPSLERKMGRSLVEIFGKSGEAAFHQCEAEIISHTIHNKEHFVMVMEESVIATEQNRKLLASEYVIYLRVSTDTQIERMKSGQNGLIPEPLLPIVNLKAFLDKQHLERDNLFEEVATLIIDSVSIEDDVNTAMKNMEEQSSKE